MNKGSKILIIFGTIAAVILVAGVWYWNQVTFCQNWASQIMSEGSGNVFSKSGEAISYNQQCAAFGNVMTTHEVPTY